MIDEAVDSRPEGAIHLTLIASVMAHSLYEHAHDGECVGG